MSELAARFEGSLLSRYFRFNENGTTLARDTIAGATTFIVMSYIIFVNPAILGFVGVEALEGTGLPTEAAAASTCLVAYVVIRMAQGAWRRIHPLMYAAGGAFTLYFLIPLLQDNLSWI